jgi:quinone-modifying oxidoreductase subunit QmoA
MEDFYTSVQKDEKFVFHRGKVAKITEKPDRTVVLEAENTLTGEITSLEVDLAVLAVGMVPNTADEPPPVEVPRDEFGFMIADGVPGVISAGVTSRPFDVAATVQDATSAALKAINASAGR